MIDNERRPIRFTRHPGGMSIQVFGEKGFPRFPWRWYAGTYGENMPFCWIEAAG